MNIAPLALFAAIPFLCAPAFANEPPPLVVKAAISANAIWANAMSTQIAANLVFPHQGYQSTMDGLVSVTFVAGEDGTPANLKITRRSGDGPLDRAATRAIGRIAMHPLPPGMQAGQKF